MKLRFFPWSGGDPIIRIEIRILIKKQFHQRLWGSKFGNPKNLYLSLAWGTIIQCHKQKIKFLFEKESSDQRDECQKELLKKKNSWNKKNLCGRIKSLIFIWSRSEEQNFLTLASSLSKIWAHNARWKPVSIVSPRAMCILQMRFIQRIRTRRGSWLTSLKTILKHPLMSVAEGSGSVDCRGQQ